MYNMALADLVLAAGCLLMWGMAAAVGSTGHVVDLSSCNKTQLDLCLESVSPLLESPLLKGIPDSQEAVLASCTAFKRGMHCVDTYAQNCWTTKQKMLLEKHVAGARHTYAFLCDDPVFQSEFLQHQSCYRGTSKDWIYCAKYFQNLVAQEYAVQNVSREEHTLGLCCAKYGFLRCVYHASQYKCQKDAALFLMKVAQTLSEVQVHEATCNKVNIDICTGQARSTSSQVWQSQPLHLIVVLLLLLSSPLFAFPAS